MVINKKTAAFLDEKSRYFCSRNSNINGSACKTERIIDTANNFRGIIAEDSCIGCGRCVSVCPMNNISLENGKALIGNNCATCLACFHWCPVEAIYMSKQENIARRRKYHHPDVTFADIAGMKNT